MTQPELDCSVHTDTRLLFDESLRTHLRPSASTVEFYADSITPDSDHFKDSNLLTPDSGDAEVICEFGDNLLNADIMLPCGIVMTKPHYCSQARQF